MTLCKQQRKMIISRLRRGEPADKIMSAEGINACDLWGIRKNANSNATSETTSKLKRDPLKNLESRGVLDDRHLRAVDKIREGHRLRIEGLSIHTASLEPRIDATHNNEREAIWTIMLERNYLKWYEMCQLEMPYIQAEIIVEMITRLVSLADIDRSWGKKKGWAKDHLVRGLELYCDRFG